MKLLLSLGLLLVSASALAAGGFTWLGGVSHNLEHAFHLVGENVKLVSNHTLTYLLVAGILLVLGLVYRTKTASIDKAIIPDKGISFRNFFEFIGEFIYNLAKSVMGDKMAKTYFPMLILFFLMIFISNIIGLIPGFLPPTDNFNTTLGMGAFVFLFYNWHGIRVQGLVGHIKHFMGPVWYLAPLIFVIELISHAVRPISLGLRLQGNMTGDHLVLTIFSDLIPYIVPIPFYVIGIFVCFMQAFVFTLLTMVYINLACEVHDHDDH